MNRNTLIIGALIVGLVAFIGLSSAQNNSSSSFIEPSPSTQQQAGPAGNPRANTQGQPVTRQTYAQQAAETCGFDYRNFGEATPQQHGCFEAKMEQRQAELAEAELRQNRDSGGGMGNFLFYILIFAGIFFVFRMIQARRQGGGGGASAMQVGKSKAKKIDDTGVTFDDVAGAEEAKEAAEDFVNFLKNPQKFTQLGGKAPKGALLTGSPGNGKTLLARAIAGEAGVPFFALAGSDFVEMFVGVGASRVRDTFEQARKHAPCIIFIDEIDAVGKKRGSGMNGGNDEREQTLNALLVEMDGIEEQELPIMIFAATNRPDTLDDALVRPGRFDKTIPVNNPDFNARIEILKVHLRNKPLSNDIDMRILSGMTAGMSGAWIANLCNEAALQAAKQGKRVIHHIDMEQAMEKLQMGAENRSLGMTDAEKEATAYHEAGHAVIQAHNHEIMRDKIYKATIVPRGRALGFVASRPDGDRVSMKFEEYIAKLDMMLAGRIAEEIQYGFDGVSTGASNDYQQATKLTQSLVREGGYIKDLIGRYAEDQGAIFGMGGGGGGVRLSEDLLKKLEAAEQKLRDEAFDRVWNLMTPAKDGEPKGELHDAWVAIANALLAHETLTGAQVMKLYEDPTYDISQEFDEDHTVPNPPRVDGIPKVNRPSKGLPKVNRKKPVPQEEPMVDETVEDVVETPADTPEDDLLPEGDDLDDAPETEEQPAGRTPRDGGPKDDT